jgi:hypothetical protein
VSEVARVIRYADLQDLIAGLTQRAGTITVRKVAGGQLKIAFRVDDPEAQPAAAPAPRRPRRKTEQDTARAFEAMDRAIKGLPPLE